MLVQQAQAVMTLERKAGCPFPRMILSNLHSLLSRPCHPHRLGVFTSATVRTVETAVTMLEQEAGVGPGELFEYGLVLHRDHTQRLEDGANHWDTCKPLARWFSRLHR